jgi:hypothetical protein
MRHEIWYAVVGMALVFVSPVSAQDRPGRFTMTPADNGFIRLDTETGAMAFCTKRSEAWACEGMPDSLAGLKRDIERLEAENKALKSEITRMEEAFGLSAPKTEPDKRADAPAPPDARPGGKLQLPTEKDVDQAMDYLTRMWRKFRDKMKELETDRGGTTL